MNKSELDSDVKDQRLSNPHYLETSQKLIQMLRNTPIPEQELLRNLFVYQDRRALSRFLFLNELYLKSIHLHGSIFEFGVRYGANTCILSSLRGIHEPYNHNRKLFAFDTFSGFIRGDSEHDGQNADEGKFGVPLDYENHLEELLGIHEDLAPIENIRKFELVKGDVKKTLPDVLKNHPETMISMAYFDFDVFEPTLACLNLIEPFLVEGAVVAFDEINVESWPGETVAMRQWIGNRKMSIKHSKYKAAAGYLTYSR